MAHGPGETELSKIMSEQGGNVVEIGGGHALLGLDDFNRSADAGVVLLPSQVERVTSELLIGARKFDLARGGFQIEKSIANIAFNSALGVLQLRAALRLTTASDCSMSPSVFPPCQMESQRAHHGKCPVSATGSRHRAVVGRKRERGIVRTRRALRAFAPPALGLGRF